MVTIRQRPAISASLVTEGLSGRRKATERTLSVMRIVAVAGNVGSPRDGHPVCAPYVRLLLYVNPLCVKVCQFHTREVAENAGKSEDGRR